MILQIAEGTNPAFAVLLFIYILTFALAFNICGGIYYPSGSFVFFNGVLSVILGCTYKVFLVTPADSNLKVPVKTMAVFCAGMGSLLLCSYVTRLTRPPRALIPGLTGEQLRWSAIGCTLIGIGGTILENSTSSGSGELSSAFAQVNHFGQMAIILGTVYAIQQSGGKRGTHWTVWVNGLFSFGFGLLSFSKEGMFEGFTTWLIPAVALGYNFKKKTIVVILGFITFAGYYLVPYSQYGRMAREEGGLNMTQALAAYDFLIHLGHTRELYTTQEDRVSDDYLNLPHFFDSQQGLFDRLQTFAQDDSLIEYTDRGNIFGLSPVTSTFQNAVPHFLWKDKPRGYGGNDYGRELGIIDAEDLTTGISFSPTADAYHEATWLGVMLLEPAVLFLLFFVADSLCGDVRLSPFGLLYITQFAHIAPEGLLGAAIYLLTFGSEAVIIVSLVSKYVLPTVTRVLAGRERTRPQPNQIFRPSLPPGPGSV